MYDSKDKPYNQRDKSSNLLQVVMIYKNKSLGFTASAISLQ